MVNNKKSKRNFISAVIGELNSRRVLRTLGAYAVVAFVVLQILDATGDALLIPHWAQTLVASLLILGFPVVFILVWMLQVTPDGIRFQRDGLLSRGQTTALFGIMMSLTILMGYGMYSFYAAEYEDGTALTAYDQPAESVAPAASIAVLPFVDMSPGQDQAFMADGIAEEILNLLAQIDGLKVAARTSSFSLRDQQHDIQTIGRLLNVSKVLEGSVRKEGDTIRLTAQLINVEDGFHIWSKTYDEQLTDIFKLQDEIAEAITKQLVASIDGASKVLPRFGRTDSLAAWEAYQTARMHWWRRTPDELQLAIELFNKAIEEDENFAAAYAGLADSWLLLNSYGNVSTEEALKRSQKLIEKAIELDPMSAEVFATLGLARTRVGELEAAESALRRAIKLDGNYIPAQLWLANLLSSQLRVHEVRQILEAALQIDPLNELLMINYSGILINSGEFDAGINKSLELVKIKPGSVGLLRSISGWLFGAGKLVEAWEYAQKALLIGPDDPLNLAVAAQISMNIGNLEESRAMVEKLSLLAPDNMISHNMSMLQMLADGQLERLDDWLTLPDGLGERELSVDEVFIVTRLAWGDLMKNDNQQALDKINLVMPQIEMLKSDSMLVEVLGLKAVAQGRLNMSDEMLYTLSQARAAVERIQDTGIEAAGVHYQLACIEALAGNVELALNEFQLAVEQGFSQAFIIRYDIRLESLRNIPKFTTLMQAIEQRNKAAREAIIALSFG